jgi:hypothetical protein
MFCIKDKRVFMINKKPYTLKNILNNYVSTINENNINLEDQFMYMNPYEPNMNISQNKECFLKNFFFNLLQELNEYFNEDFSSFSISQWYH